MTTCPGRARPVFRHDPNCNPSKEPLSKEPMGHPRTRRNSNSQIYRARQPTVVRIIIIIISGFGIYGAAVVPDSGVGNTWQRLTLVLHGFLSDGLTPSRLHIVISFLTHADHVFLGLPRSLVPGSPKRVMELMHEQPDNYSKPDDTAISKYIGQDS